MSNEWDQVEMPEIDGYVDDDYVDEDYVETGPRWDDVTFPVSEEV